MNGFTIKLNSFGKVENGLIAAAMTTQADGRAERDAALLMLRVDQETKRSDYDRSRKTTVWTKSSDAGQTFMQSVGNNLFFANGIDQWAG